ncbi:MAG: hypothetical protein V8S84_03870 [Lachnospiraceae bacterium]
METVFLPNLTKATLIDTRTAHGVNSYSYTIAPGERTNITFIYLTPENTVNIVGAYRPANANLCIGISNGNSYKNYIYPTGSGYSPIFSAPSVELIKFSCKILEIKASQSLEAMHSNL